MSASTFTAALDAVTAVVEEFGGAVTYTRKSGEVVAIAKAAFDSAFQEVSVDGDGHPVMTVSPTLYLRLSDLGGVMPAKNDRFAVGGITYVVQTVEIDGAGGATCKAVRA